MPSGAASPVFAGRAAELAALHGAFAAAVARTPATILIGGEPGYGKTRLVAEFTAAVADRALLLRGGCVELSAAGLPYAPFTAMLRGLVRARGTEAVTTALPGRQAGELARLLPELGAPPAAGDAELATARLFDAVLSLLEWLAERQALVIVVEDVQWADRATCDLLSFLTASLRDTATLLLVTFRSDEAGADSLRQLLPRLDRMAGVTRIELGSLARGEVAAQLAGILGRDPGPGLVTAVHARGHGIPLFTEALVSPDGTLIEGVPQALRYLLRARIAEFPGQTRQVLGLIAIGGTESTSAAGAVIGQAAPVPFRAADSRLVGLAGGTGGTVGGGQVGHDLLAAVSGLDEQALIGALRPAVACHVLASDGDGYSFAHQLYREAVLADMLAGERATAHRAFAEAIEADRSWPHGVNAARLALHWRGAGDRDRALAAAWHAAASPGMGAAHAQRLAMLEQVLEVWDQAADASGRTGTDRTGVLEVAADAARWAGEPERGLALVAEVLSGAEAAGASPRVAMALRRRAALRRDLLLPGTLDDLREALRLADDPTPARAEILAQLCWALRRADYHEEALRLAGDLAELASQLGDAERQAEATLLLAAVGAHQGADTVTGLRAALDAAAGLGAGQLEAWCYLTAGHVLEDRGSHELAIAWGRDGLARARQLGLGRQLAAPIAGNLAESLTSAGRWDEALEIVEEILSLGLPPLGRGHAVLVRGQIAVLRGDAEAAEAALAELRDLPAGLLAESQNALPLAQLEIDLRLASGDLAAALALAGALPGRQGEGNPWYEWALLAAATRAVADAAEAGLASAAREDLARLAASLARRNPRHDAYALTVAAEASRAEGHHDAAAWDKACAAWDSLGGPYLTAYCLLHAARALLADDRAIIAQAGLPAASSGSAPQGPPRGADRRVSSQRREAAAVRLRRSAELAGRLGARPLRARVSRVARQARVDLPAGPLAVPPPSRLGLTDRELEVLRLVAAGRNNRDIAAELFISPKTASVHVSNILGKLGVSSRVGAAAIAHREHLFDA